MSRYTGPRMKKMRALDCELPGLSPKPGLDRRPYPPGQHGPNTRRRKYSDFKLQLMEKQKLRFNYGVGERQLRRLFEEAEQGGGNTGEKLGSLLERRFDNVVFRARFTVSIPAARQLINHGHLRLNGKKVNIPSIRIQKGDVITLRPKSQKLALVEESFERLSRIEKVDWLTVDQETRTITVKELPTHQSVPLEVSLQRVVEFYSR